MGQALYRKYRPKKLTDVIGQEHITTTLKNSIDNGSLSHAYLLTGPRGVGKTSIARILAHEINKLDYDEKANHLDIIEIDAASNRRIDEIRDLRDKVNILPAVVEYKVYIIDEVHMLTREAFNALLKTLEEPPKHAIFILATTEAHKLPATIISRTQHFSFKPIDQDNLFKHLKNIAKQEGINIDDDALKLIALHGDGSFRDSISLLDQTATSKTNIDVSSIESMLGLAPKQTIAQLVNDLEKSSPKEIMAVTEELRDRGVQTSVLSKQLAEELRFRIINEIKFQKPEFLKLLESIINAPSSINPTKQLEIELLGFVIANAPSESVPELITKKEPAQIKKATPRASQPVAEKEPEEIPAPANAEVPVQEVELTTPAEQIGDLTDGTWPKILDAIKKNYNTLYGVLRMAKIDITGSKLTLSFKFPFHKKKIDDQKNKAIISQVIKSQTGQDFEIITVVADQDEQPKPKTEKKTNAVSSVSDIFGGAELLES